MIAALWALGALSVFGISLAGLIRVRKLIKRCHPVDLSTTPEFQLALEALPDPHSRLTCLLSPDLQIPLAFGWLHPVVILPEAALEWSAEMLRVAVAHESAHIERNDVFSSAFARAVLSLYWFHPMAWLAWRQLRAQAEMAADDCVVLAEADPITYAEGLMSLVRSLRSNEASLFPAVGMLRSRGIEARVERILNPNARRLAAAKGVRWAAIVAVPMLFAVALTVRPIAALAQAAVAKEQPAPFQKLTLPQQEVLIEAIGENDLPKAISALNAGADPNVVCDYNHPAGGYLGQSTALYFAAEQGHLEIVKYLLDHGADMKAAKSGRWTPLDVALYTGQVEVIKYLHEHGAECDPLVYAGVIGDVDAVTKLLPTASAKSVADATVAAAGCNQIATLRTLLGDKGDPANAFKRAGVTGAIEAMQFLLDHGLNLKAVGDQALLWAADNRHPRSVDFLLKAGVKPDPEKHVEYYPLHWAARSNDLESVKLLLDAGANPNCQVADPDMVHDQGTTPIFEAAGRDNVEMVKLLIERGARVDIITHGGFTPPLYAVFAHAPHTLAYFLDHGADPKAVNPQWKSGYMEFAMIFTGEDAARPDQHVTIDRVSREMETVKVMLDHGMDVNAPGINGMTPISIAVTNGQTACIEMLLQNGAKVNTIDPNGETLLINVLSAPVKDEWRNKVIDRLFAAGLDVNAGIDNPANPNRAITSALKTAILHQPKLVKLMLDHGARFPVEKGSDTEKMLMAATTGDLAAVQDLLARGVSPDVADRKGWTPLLIASIRADSAILRALVAAGANVNARDALGLTPVQFSLFKYPDLSDFHLFLEKGADLNADTGLMIAGPVLYQAINQVDPALTREILQHGANPNRSPKSKDSNFDPITLAAEVLLMRDAKNEKRREIVKILLEFGADPNHPSRPKERPLLYFPVTNNMVDLVKFLLQAGIDPHKDPDGGKTITEQAQRHGNAEMKALIKAALEKGPDEPK